LYRLQAHRYVGAIVERRQRLTPYRQDVLNIRIRHRREMIAAAENR